jgi:uncharacterized membrane protein YebE (DUF533 family)
MDEFFNTVNLGLNHVQIIIRGMYAVAKADEVHQTELILIREFYDGCRRDVEGLADFDDVIAQEFDSEVAAEILTTPTLRHTLLKSCILLAFADGGFSPEERDVIEQMATDLGVSDDELKRIREEVQDFLIQQISMIQNMDALREVVQEFPQD